jgi:large subunit ribosomal protein L20
MPRATNNVAAHRRHKKFLDKAKGNYGGRRKQYRSARETVQKGMVYAYRDRRVKKRLFRRLWIVRINAAVQQFGMRYNRFMDGLKKSGVTLDRKVLADLAVRDQQAFAELVKVAQSAA